MPRDRVADSASSLLSVETALARILDGLAPLTARHVALAQANGRTLASDLVAQVSLPAHDLSAMDGYAVRAADCVPGTPLTRIGESAAGHPFEGDIGQGQTVRIFTGAVVPAGADAILLQEDADATAEIDGATVMPRETVASGTYIRPAGLDVTEGKVILKAGTWLSARAIALAVSAGHVSAEVWDQPRIGILSTGDELASPGTPLKPGQIYSSNAVYLASFVAQCGGIAVDLGTAADQPGAVLAHVRAASQPLQLIVTTGGASVGTHDHIAGDLSDSGAAMDFWKIAMRPGKPLIHGQIDGIPLLGLPGNPVSSAVCALIFLRPALACLAGHDYEHSMTSAVLTTDLPENDRRQDYLRSVLGHDEYGNAIVTPTARQDSSMIGVFAAANALVVRPPFDPSRAAGDVVKVIRLNPRL